MVQAVSHGFATMKAEFFNLSVMQAGFVVDKWHQDRIFSKQLYFLQYSIFINHLGLTKHTHLRLQ
jgi:hypothetical protein